MNQDFNKLNIAFSLLQLALEVEKLNKLITETFEEESKQIALIDHTTMLKQILPYFFKSIRAKLSEITKRSVGIEMPLRGVYHGTSLVDVCSAANQYFEVIKGLELSDQIRAEAYKSYEEILISVMLQYAKLNETFCNESLQFVDVNNLPPELKKRAVINFNWMQTFNKKSDDKSGEESNEEGEEDQDSEQQLIVTKDVCY